MRINRRKMVYGLVYDRLRRLKKGPKTPVLGLRPDDAYHRTDTVKFMSTR